MPDISEIDVCRNRLRRFSLKPVGKASKLRRLDLKINYLTTIEFSEDVEPTKLEYIEFGNSHFNYRHQCYCIPQIQCPSPLEKDQKQHEAIINIRFASLLRSFFLALASAELLSSTDRRIL